MNIIKRISLGITAIVTMFVFLAFPADAVAQTPKDEVCKGVSGVTGKACDDAGLIGGLDSTIATVIDLLSVVIGVIAVVMIIIGGLKYIMSGGDSNSTSSAKNTILFALVGLVIVALAQVIAEFVLFKIR